MSNKKIDLEYYPEELAQKLYSMTEDMDFLDYEETKEQTIEELSDALYHLQTIAKNEYNKQYWRTFWNALQLI